MFSLDDLEQYVVIKQRIERITLSLPRSLVLQVKEDLLALGYQVHGPVPEGTKEDTWMLAVERLSQ